MSRKVVITIVAVALTAAAGLALTGDERAGVCQVLCPGDDAAEE